MENISYKSLRQELEAYKTILNLQTIEYLNELLNLNISVLNEEKIGIDNMERLMQLDIYQKLAAYNIYTKALHLFQRESKQIELNIMGKEDSLTIYGEQPKTRTRFPIYMYNRNKNGKIYICFNKTHATFETHEICIKTLRELIRNLKEENRNSENKMYEMNESLISSYNEMLQKLIWHYNPSKEETYEINLQNHFFNLLLETYGIDFHEGFEKENPQIIFTSNPTAMHESYVKQYPNIVVKTKVKNI